MALKKLVTSDEHKKLAKELQGLYVEKDGTFVLDLETGDDDDAGALKRAKDHEKRLRKEAEENARKLQEQLDAITKEKEEAATSNAKKKGDVDSIEKSWQEKLAKREKELNDQLAIANGELTKMLVDNVAQQIASEISTAPSVIMPHIKSRLRAEFKDGKAATRIVDAEGNPTALTLDDLKKDFVANKDFAPIIAASKASGGGAGGAGSGGGATGGKVDFSKSPKEIVKSLQASGKIKAD
jgi:hypothetical protein